MHRRPRTQRHWNERYVSGDLPWDTQRHDGHLEELLSQETVSPCRAMEFGCGTGTNAIWLAQHGFEMTALDLSSVAIERAREKATAEDAHVEFLVDDIVRLTKIPDKPFEFVFDRGCFHSLYSHRKRLVCARAVWQHLADDGLWFSLIGSTDGPTREVGPPRRSAKDIARAVEPWFEILRLRTTFFDSDLPDPPRAWACLMRKRTV